MTWANTLHRSTPNMAPEVRWVSWPLLSFPFNVWHNTKSCWGFLKHTYKPPRIDCPPWQSFWDRSHHTHSSHFVVASSSFFPNSRSTHQLSRYYSATLPQATEHLESGNAWKLVETLISCVKKASGMMQPKVLALAVISSSLFFSHMLTRRNFRLPVIIFPVFFLYCLVS